LNSEKLAIRLTFNKQNSGGIDKLNAFLNFHKLNLPQMISFLRNLQSLRSTGVAHRKGVNYEKVKKSFDIGKKDLPVIFEDILIKCIWVLNTLENRFLK
jgi:hypothetical protein